MYVLMRFLEWFAPVIYGISRYIKAVTAVSKQGFEVVTLVPEKRLPPHRRTEGLFVCKPGDS